MVSGVVGFDLAEDAYFFRGVPGGKRRFREQPRLAKARALVEAGTVTLDDANGRRRGFVKGRDGDYLVSLDPSMSCTCPWFAAHGSTRGPCSHALAVQLSLFR